MNSRQRARGGAAHAPTTDAQGVCGERTGAQIQGHPLSHLCGGHRENHHQPARGAQRVPPAHRAGLWTVRRAALSRTLWVCRRACMFTHASQDHAKRRCSRPACPPSTSCLLHPPRMRVPVSSSPHVDAPGQNAAGNARGDDAGAGGREHRRHHLVWRGPECLLLWSPPYVHCRHRMRLGAVGACLRRATTTPLHHT